MVFGAFDTGRAENVTYPDRRFDEVQAFMALRGCGTSEGQSRMENVYGEVYTPHGDTHLRTVNKFSTDTIQSGFTQSIENLLDAVNDAQIRQRPVTAGIDSTTWEFHADGDPPSEVNGTKDPGRRAYTFATLSLAGKRMPISLTEETEEGQATYDVETWEALEQTLADGDRSSTELRDRRDGIEFWRENQEDRRLIKHALARYSDVEAAREQLSGYSSSRRR